jgi:taurine dioxygenase
MRRRPGSTRPALTAEQRAQRPPSVHPVLLTHPITGRKVLYANPGYTVHINKFHEAESDRILQDLFRHQLQPKYQYAHHWTEGDVLMWDHIGTLHNAIPDYRPDEHRLIERCGGPDLRSGLRAREPRTHGDLIQFGLFRAKSHGPPSQRHH